MSSAGKLDLDPTAYRDGPDKVAAHHEMEHVNVTNFSNRCKSWGALLIS